MIRAFRMCIGLALAGAAMLMASPMAAAIAIEVSPASLTTSSSIFSVDIDVSGAADLYAFQFDIGFDPALLAAVSQSGGSFLASGGPTFFLPGIIDNVGGTISFTADTLLTAIAGVSGSGTLAVIDFQVLTPGTSAISIFNAQLLDSALNGLSFTVADGSVTAIPALLPEPGSLLLLGLGLPALVIFRRRRIGMSERE